MAAPLATNVKQEEPDPDTGLCLICTLPIRIPGGEPDALLCNQCGVVYHRACAPEWTRECSQCRSVKVSRWTRPPPPPADEVVDLSNLPSVNSRLLVYWPNEKRWFPGRVTSATTSTAVVRYDDGDTSSVEVGDRWVLESPAPSGEIQHPLDASSVARRGKVKWGRGWWDVEEMGNVWVFVKGGLRVAPASLKTLVCPDRDATSLQLPSDEMDRNLGSSGEWDGDEMVEEEEIEAAAKMRKKRRRMSVE